MNEVELAAKLLLLFWASMHVEMANRAWLGDPEPLVESWDKFWGAMRHDS